jgi:outer membrane protein OmpA-like peptidoglycan-associated protein
MARPAARALAVAALVVGSLAGCSAGSLLSGRIDGIREVVEQAERNGAYRCAPRELALAKANLDFAEAELALGQAHRAEEHLAIAEPNARAAFRLSPAARCAPRGVAVVRRPEVPRPPPAPGDRDGDGILDPDDRCPDDPEDYDGYEDADGCPEQQDSDGDGLHDDLDACPAEPEDVDGYLDDDGCPEPDNDLDGIPDASDQCANDPEDPDGYRDDDGCPERDNDTDGIPDVSDRCPNEPGPESEQGCPRVYQDVQVTGTAIRITQMIHFEFNRAVIRPESFGILNTVAQVLKDYPTITIEVQGHTDSRGNDDFNMRLSQSRADAVREYLIGQGIAASRLTSRGYGETMPIDSNRSSAGRAANRRVEFVRTDAGATRN